MNTTLSPSLLLAITGGYFLLLICIAWYTGRNASNQDFFNANKKSPWYIVAFGMVGASLSGVTFISVPGMVGITALDSDKINPANMQFSYMQMVFGYFLGYWIIARLLLPLYYKLGLTSIYGYLQQRFGFSSYKTGAAFFLISRTVGAAFRLYLVAMVLQLFIFDQWGIPFWVTAASTIVLIWVYTFQGGIKTIIWTDTLQTACMLIAVILATYELSTALNLNTDTIWSAVETAGIDQMIFFEGGWTNPNNFFKQLLAGMFLAIVMTGLDQDMMQKNLSCPNLGDAQKNMFSLSVVLIVVNFIFLLLGALLAIYALQNNISVERSDSLFPVIALQHLSATTGIVFIIGLVAAAYSSADSALTSLTTSFCVDILGTERRKLSRPAKTIRMTVHVGFSVLLFIVLLGFWWINDQSVINALFKFAGYTYGPLLGLFSFGLFTHRTVKDKGVPIVCILAPVLTYVINANSETLLFGYKFGFELLLVNGLLTFAGLYLLSEKEQVNTTEEVETMAPLAEAV